MQGQSGKPVHDFNICLRVLKISAKFSCSLAIKIIILAFSFYYFSCPQSSIENGRRLESEQSEHVQCFVQNNSRRRTALVPVLCVCVKESKAIERQLFQHPLKCRLNYWDDPSV